MKLIFPRQVWDELQEHLLGKQSLIHEDETLAFLLASPSEGRSGVALLVREILKPGPLDYEHRSGYAIRPTADFVAKALSACRIGGYGLIEVHTHPFDSGDGTTFSGTDWANDYAKMPQLSAFMPESFRHATMVMGRKTFDAHFYDRISKEVRPILTVSIVGSTRGSRVVEQLLPNSAPESSRAIEVSGQYDRHARFLGAEGVSRLRQSSVAVVGLGGLGAFAAIELAHLGVGELILIDPDRVELTNMNRLIGASMTDLGRLKVDVFADRISDLSAGQTQPVTVAEPVQSQNAVAALKGCDVLLGCLDNHGGRLILNQLALQYLIPLIDAGTGVKINPTLQYGGQAQLVAPGRGCLLCRGFIDATRAAFDLASDEQQTYERSHGYGTSEPAPSVIALNGVVSSIQVLMLMRLLAQDGLSDDIVTYDGARSRMFPAQIDGKSDCEVCGDDGLAAYGDLLSIEPRHVSQGDRGPSVPLRAGD